MTMPHVHVDGHISRMVSARSGLLEFALQYDKAKLDSELAALASIPGAARKAIQRAIDRSISGTRTDIVGIVHKKMTVRAKDVRSALSVLKARWTGVNYSGAVRVKGKGLPLMAYDVKPRRQTAMKGRLPARYKHLSYLLERQGQRHGYKGEDGDRSLFVANVHGKLGVYYRQGAARDRINQVWGPTIQFHVSPEETRAEILRGADRRFHRELVHQVQHLAGGGK